MDSWLKPRDTINHRYRILRSLGQGKLGRTYLAKDSHRFDELCLLQEFAPQVNDPGALKKTEELFQRKAKVLYTLNHPQIPRFHELFMVEENHTRGLFLVQDYITGTSYRELLNHRLSRGSCFSEAEVTQFLLQLLPVLQYLHDQNIIHRDITPDNIIYRSSDGLPVLIDFGSVKQLSVIANNFFKQSQPFSGQITQIGQIGYAPQEQITIGLVSAHSDLYGLAATALVLLTGQEPFSLIDPHTSNWNWPEQISVSLALTDILRKMLAKNPQERYNCAQDVLEALTLSPVQSSSVQVAETVATQPTIKVVSGSKNPNISPASHDEAMITLPLSDPDTNMALTTSSRKNSLSGCLGKLIFISLLILGSGIVGWLAGKAWITQVLQNNEGSNSQVFTDQPTQNNPSQISDAELDRKNELRRRRQDLGLDYSFFVSLVDELFWNKYPEQKGRSLSSTSEDQPWREKWDEIATNLLDFLESLSREAVEQMGSYSEDQLEIWKQKVNNLNLSSRALYDLVDARFFTVFPEWENQSFMEQPLGQLWNGIVADTLTALQSGSNYEKLIFMTGEGNTIDREATLQPGEGKAYVVEMNAEQSLEVELSGNQHLLLSIYSPTGNNNLLEDSTQYQWSGTLPETGYYELTVVSKANQPVNYKLKIRLTENNN